MSRLRQVAHVLLRLEDTPGRIALAFGLGIFIAFFPLLGIHTGLALLIAFVFRLSRVAILAGAWTNNPWTIAPMYMAGTLLGCALLDVPSAGLSAKASSERSCAATNVSRIRPSKSPSRMTVGTSRRSTPASSAGSTR